MLHSIISSKTIVQQSNWNDPTSLHEELIQEVNDYIAEVRDRNVSHLLEQEKVLLADELERPVNIHLKEANTITWVEIRRNLEDKTQSAIFRLLDALSDFGLEEGMSKDLVQQLENHVRNSVRDKARRIANPTFIIALMRERFQDLFTFDSNSVPCIWGENAEIEAAIQTAHSESVKILSILAAIRFVDDNDAIEETLSAAFRIAHEAIRILNSINWGQSVKILSVLASIHFVDDNDAIEETLSTAFRIAHEAMRSLNSAHWRQILSVLAAIRFVDDNDAIEETLSAAFRIAQEVMRSLNSTNWGQIPQEDTLLDPFGCRVLWSDFLIQTAPIVNQAFEEVWQKKKQKYIKLALAIGVTVASGAGTVAAVAGGDGVAVTVGGAAASVAGGGGAANAARVAARIAVSLIAPLLLKGNSIAQAFGRN